MTYWHPALRRLSDQFGDGAVRRACHAVLGFPPEMADDGDEIRAVAKRLRSV